MEIEYPEEYLRRIKKFLKTDDEYESFLDSMQRKPETGLRLNIHKLLSLHDKSYKYCYDKMKTLFSITPIDEPNCPVGGSLCQNSERRKPTLIDEPICPASGSPCQNSEWQKTTLIDENAVMTFDSGEAISQCYVVDKTAMDRNIQPGKHPYHAAGLYYLQEPSAMRLVPRLNIRPYDRVLDLCASPGGKATQAADYLSHTEGGFLIANEFSGSRARTLSSNIERMGIPNAIVLNEDPERLAKRFPAFFTRIIVDAPCSGEGMFRKNPDAIKEWSIKAVESCVKRQRKILYEASVMLSPGGMLGYSTCTFEEEEDEGNVAWLLENDRSLSLVYEKKIWPHREIGEGHYIAIFKKAGEESLPSSKESSFKEVCEKNRVSLVPDYFPDTRGLKLLRAGIPVKTLFPGGRWEPEHAMSHACISFDGLYPFPIMNLLVEDPRVGQYLHGMEINLTQTEAEKMEKGFILICCDGAALGFGKLSGCRVKNHYPKGLRFL